MRGLLMRIRCDSGQAFVFVAVALMALVGMAALVIDGGSWYRADRHAQTAADAAALAGAQELPDRGNAEDLAHEYWLKNPDDSTIGDTLDFTDPAEPEYQITVKVTRKADGFFAKIFDIDSVKVAAEAQAQVTAPLSMKNVAPIAVKDTAACTVEDPDCFGPSNPVTVNFDESDIASSLMGLINVKCNSDFSSGCGPGETGGREEEDMIKCDPQTPDKGCNSAVLPSNKWYGVKTGGTYGPIEHGLNYAAAKGTTLLFPVFDKSCPGDPSCGPNDKSFHIIGWAAFVIEPDGVNWPGGDKKVRTLTGYFTTFIATDLASGGSLPDHASDFGVHVITLTH
jgi:hypothetical protein